MKLKGKVSIITGATITYRLAKEEYTVFINDLDSDSLTKTYRKSEDIASITVYLSKEETCYITGQVISVNGGFLT